MCDLLFNIDNIKDAAFHHIDPNEKDFCIGNKRDAKMEKLYLEVDKCAMLCKKCHRLVHSKLYRHIFPKLLLLKPITK